MGSNNDVTRESNNGGEGHYEVKRARNNEAVRKCRNKKKVEQERKERQLIYLERGMLPFMMIVILL